jgi:branched-chain amino acid transport system permease protein
LLAFGLGGDAYVAGIVIETLFWIAASSAWNILGGYTGLISLGHALFIGVSSYAVAFAVNHNVSWWLATPLTVFGVTILGTLLLYPGFRLRGPFFSLATFALPLIAATVAVYAKPVTGGPEGVTWPISPSASQFIFVSRTPYLLTIGVIAAAAVIVSLYVDRRAVGRSMRAVADDQTAAEASGVPSTRIRLIATALSIAITALAGCFYVTYVAFVDPASAFSLDVSLKVVLIAILGGLGRPFGPLLGAILLIPADSWLADSFPGGLHVLLYACLLMALVIFLPQGLIGGGRQLLATARTRWTKS